MSLQQPDIDMDLLCEIILLDTFTDVKILRGCLWFAKGQKVTRDEFLAYYTTKAVESLRKDLYIEISCKNVFD